MKGTALNCRFSIIIPVLHEADKINHIIEHIHSQNQEYSYEIIVVDGAPERDTINAIDIKNHVRPLVSGQGRAMQMNAGASIARGDILVFLHADTLLPDGGLEEIDQALKDEAYIGGAFDLGIDSDEVIFKIISFVASLRSRLTRIPYGDQAIFIRKEYFHRVKGYPDIPLMEDVELMRRIKRQGDKICIIPDRVVTSPRRWKKEGILYTTLRNWTILLLYMLGISPFRLKRFYHK